MKNYKNLIGDGKLPNKYWVFQYNQQYKSIDGTLELIKEDTETKESLLGEFKSYKEALNCVDDKAYLPNVVIEDRISGQVFEQLQVVCQCCGKIDYETYSDINLK